MTVVPLTPPPSSSRPPITIRGLEAPKVLLMGAPGSGKTWSIHTLLKAGIEVFVLITEPNSLESLLLACQKTGTPTEKLHWAVVSPQTAGWDALSSLAKQVNSLDYEGVTKLKDVNKRDSKQLYAILENLQNFRDDRTNLFFGDVTSWDDSRALVIDSLSGLNTICVQATVGLKPTMAPGEWNICMNVEETLINKLTSDMKAYFILIAHIDRNQNEASLQTVVTPAAIGAKLGPRIGRFFSEVVLAKRTGTEFVWSTSEAMTDTKQRTLPISNAIPPSFLPLIEAHNKRKTTI